MSSLFETHRELLEKAVNALRERTYWSPFSESPKAYGEGAPAEGKAAFEALLGKPFTLRSAHATHVGAEVSPIGLTLGITYPAPEPSQLIAAAEEAREKWAAAPIETRIGITLEILARLNRASFLIGHAVEHTTGQASGMAFQAGGPHAQDRGLEAVAYAYAEMSAVPSNVRWEKPAGRNVIRLDKQFRIVPRGIGLVIGCATFPTWNSYPALFADLATGNAVIVKPHPLAILPLALTVKIGQDVLAEQGFSPDVLQLAPDTAAEPVTKILATDPAIGIVDFTGSSAFGGWLRENLRGKQLFTEEAGVNTIVIDSCHDFKAMCDNIAFSISLYSGQMCTAPQAIFVPAEGIKTPSGPVSFEDTAKGIASAVDALLADPARAAGVLGAIQNPETLSRIANARKFGRVIRDSASIAGSGGRTASPLIVAVSSDQEAAYGNEQFGPISFIVTATDSRKAIRQATRIAATKGAITAALYSTDTELIEEAIPQYTQAGAALSINLTGGIFVNQNAAFSDYHVSGANPAGNASLTDSAFIAGRFHVVGIRQPALS